MRTRDRALLIKRFPFGESSLVAHVATRAHGRIHVLAKGAYRPTSRYFAVLDLFDTLELAWDKGPRQELANLRSGELAVRRGGIARDLARYRAGVAVLELADLAFRPEHADHALFDVLEATFDELEAARAAPDLVLVAFELGFLQSAGLAPALDRCAACGGEAAPLVAGVERGPYAARAAFSAGAGGRLCRSCADQARASGRRVGTLPLAVLDTARELLQGGPRSLAAGAIDQERIDRVRDFVGRFLDYHLESRPRMHRAFLSAPNRNAP